MHIVIKSRPPVEMECAKSAAHFGVRRPVGAFQTGRVAGRGVGSENSLESGDRSAHSKAGRGGGPIPGFQVCN